MLKSARITKGLSQKELSERIKISQAYLSQLENNQKYKKIVTTDVIGRISEELDLDPIEVFVYLFNTRRHKKL